ncbi:T9SS type A sorting domain-containing protein [Adhaeribacter terreus]|uniref:T9SS type A sorting domain-containing protein n=1 Tax=Adhaeribacter terreus TaxID=529703 RepID=A0ABW0ECA8_9BACT
MTRLSLLISFIISLILELPFNSYAQILPGNNPNPYGICELPPPGCQEIPICTYYDDCFRFDFYQPVNRPDGTTVLKHKITNFSESTFKQAAFELPGSGSPRTPAILPTTSFRNRYNHSVVNPFNDTMIAYNAINAGTFSYGGFEMYYYIVNTADFNAASGRFITITAKAGRPWQLQRTGTVVIEVDECLGVQPCTPPTANISGPDTVCLFNDDPYVFTTPALAGATYNWSVTNATIIEGNGTNTVSVVPDIDFGPGLITVVVANQCDSATATKEFEVIDCDTIVPLPVSLRSFKGQVSSGGISLKWQTASEQNNDRFEVERSTDGKHFEKIGMVKGNGNSSNTIAYNFLDRHPQQGTNYYRLKQVDFDGKFEYSNIIWVQNTDKSSAFSVMMAPNPCIDGKCNVQLQNTDQSQPVTVEIRDLTGRMVFSKEIPNNQTTFELPKLETGAGIYILSARNGQYTAIQKVILK